MHKPTRSNRHQAPNSTPTIKEALKLSSGKGRQRNKSTSQDYDPNTRMTNIRGFLGAGAQTVARPFARSLAHSPRTRAGTYDQQQQQSGPAPPLPTLKTSTARCLVDGPGRARPIQRCQGTCPSTEKKSSDYAPLSQFSIHAQ